MPITVKIHSADKDNPFIELISASGRSAALNLRVLAEQHAGTLVGRVLAEIVLDLANQKDSK